LCARAIGQPHNPVHLSVLGNFVSGALTPVLAMAIDFSATWRRRVVTHAQERQQKLRPSFLRIACRDRGPRIDPFRTIHRLLPVGPSSGNDRAKAHRRIGEYRSSWIASEWVPRDRSGNPVLGQFRRRKSFLSGAEFLKMGLSGSISRSVGLGANGVAGEKGCYRQG